MEKDTQVRHNSQASRRSLRASLYNWRHTSSVENKTSRCLRFGHSRYLYVLLTFDIWLDDRQRRPPDGGHEIAVRPSVGNRDFRVRNSCRKMCEETPLRCLTKRWIPNCGSTSTSTCTWSGMISRAMISARYLSATCLSTCSHRLATRPTSTARRYLGVHTQWYLLE